MHLNIKYCKLVYVTLLAFSPLSNLRLESSKGLNMGRLQPNIRLIKIWLEFTMMKQVVKTKSSLLLKNKVHKHCNYLQR
jgi:hypothetical protein